MRLDQYAGILKQLDSAKSTADVDLIPLTGFETQKGLEDFLTRRDAKKKELAANDLQAYANVLSDPEFQTPEAQMHLGERATGWADPANPNSVSALQGAGDKAFTVGALAELNQKARSGEQIDPMLAARLSVQSGNLLDNYMKLPELAGKQATNTDNQAFNEAMAVINANQYPMTPAGFTQYQTDVRDMAANTGQTPQIADEIINREGARWQGTGIETKPYTLRTGRATETGTQTVNPFGKVIDTQNVSYTEPVRVAGAGGHGGGGGRGAKGQRPMPAATEKRLSNAAELADSIARFSSGFVDGYGGHTFLGEASNTAGRIFGDVTGQSQWWQDYQGYVNDIRQEKFGASLTNNEKNEFLKYIVTPRMNAKEIRQNLTRQKMITDSALARMARGYARQYDPETVSEFIGRDIPSAEEARPPRINYDRRNTPSKVIRYDSKGNRVQ